jgi:hypothetical protein
VRFLFSRLLTLSFLFENRDEAEKLAAKARKAVRQNNFTQQTNTLDVDKHMYYCFNLKMLISVTTDTLHQDGIYRRKP